MVLVRGVPPVESVAVTELAKVPVADTVPDHVPLLALREHPVGRLLEDHE